MKKINVAIIGATGLVGQTFLKIIQEINEEKFNFKLFASQKSINKKIKYYDKYLLVHELNEKSFDDVSYAIFFTDASLSKYYIPIAISKNVICIDNSSYFRLKKDVKLISYSVNESLIEKNDTLIANPNCCTIQCVTLLNLLKKYQIKNIIYNTYQSVSGSGKQGIDDLLRCRKGLMPIYYETDISFTCIPKIGEYNDNFNTDEEDKMIQETKKILNDYTIDILATCVRVPVMFSHGVSVIVKLNKDFTISEIKDIFNSQKNIVICENIVPSSILSCNNDKIYVGRIRKHNDYLLFYCVADNVRVGAATNALNILNHLIILKEQETDNG